MHTELVHIKTGALRERSMIFSTVRAFIWVVLRMLAIIPETRGAICILVATISSVCAVICQLEFAPSMCSFVK